MAVESGNDSAYDPTIPLTHEKQIGLDCQLAIYHGGWLVPGWIIGEDVIP
jgi:hypothetical protein